MASCREPRRDVFRVALLQGGALSSEERTALLGVSIPASAARGPPPSVTFDGRGLREAPDAPGLKAGKAAASGVHPELLRPATGRPHFARRRKIKGSSSELAVTRSIELLASSFVKI